jgi:hypothetical protein
MTWPTRGRSSRCGGRRAPLLWARSYSALYVVQTVECVGAPRVLAPQEAACREPRPACSRRPSLPPPAPGRHALPPKPWAPAALNADAMNKPLGCQTLPRPQICCFSAVSDLLNKTGVSPKQIGIVITNCSLFNPTPSLSATIMNHFGMPSSTINYNLGGMGCSGGLGAGCRGRGRQTGRFQAAILSVATP